MRRFVAAFTAFTFTFQSFAWPVPPADGVRIDSPPETPSFIHIQDAHASPEAQEKIRDILKSIGESGPRSAPILVALEGSLGPLHPEYLDLFPKYPRVNEALVHDLLEESLLSGPELFAWEKYQQSSLRKNPNGNLLHVIARARSTRNNLEIVGVETPRLYRTNLKAYRDFFQNEDQISQGLRRFRHRLESAERKVLNPELRRFVRESERRSSELSSFIRFLARAAFSHLGIDLRDRFEQIRFPNLTRLLFLMEFEKKINRREQSLVQSEIDSKGLFEETEILERGVRQKLIRNESEQRLLETLDDFKLLEKLFSLDLTWEEYRRVTARPNPFKFSRRWEASYQTALRFYRLAERRNLALLQNTLKAAKRMEKHFGKKPKILLVTGGFHTAGLTQLLKERSIPYDVITPRITKMDSSPSHYHQWMTGKGFSSVSSGQADHLAFARILTGRNLRPLLTGLDARGRREQETIFQSELRKAKIYLKEFGLSEEKAREALREAARRINANGVSVPSRAEVREGKKEIKGGAVYDGGLTSLETQRFLLPQPLHITLLGHTTHFPSSSVDLPLRFNHQQNYKANESKEQSQRDKKPIRLPGIENQSRKIDSHQTQQRLRNIRPAIGRQFKHREDINPSSVKVQSKTDTQVRPRVVSETKWLLPKTTGSKVSHRAEVRSEESPSRLPFFRLRWIAHGHRFGSPFPILTVVPMLALSFVSGILKPSSIERSMLVSLSLVFAAGSNVVVECLKTVNALGWFQVNVLEIKYGRRSSLFNFSDLMILSALVLLLPSMSPLAAIGFLIVFALAAKIRSLSRKGELGALSDDAAESQVRSKARAVGTLRWQVGVALGIFGLWTVSYVAGWFSKMPGLPYFAPIAIAGILIDALTKYLASVKFPYVGPPGGPRMNLGEKQQNLPPRAEVRNEAIASIRAKAAMEWLLADLARRLSSLSIKEKPFTSSEVLAWFLREPVLDLGTGDWAEVPRWLEAQGSFSVSGLDERLRPEITKKNPALKKGQFQDPWPFRDNEFRAVLSFFSLGSEVPSIYPESSFFWWQQADTIYPHIAAELKRTLGAGGLAALVIGDKRNFDFEKALEGASLKNNIQESEGWWTYYVTKEPFERVMRGISEELAGARAEVRGQALGGGEIFGGRWVVEKEMPLEEALPEILQEENDSKIYLARTEGGEPLFLTRFHGTTPGRMNLLRLLGFPVENSDFYLLDYHPDLREPKKFLDRPKTIEESLDLQTEFWGGSWVGPLVHHRLLGRHFFAVPEEWPFFADAQKIEKIMGKELFQETFGQHQDLRYFNIYSNTWEPEENLHLKMDTVTPYYLTQSSGGEIHFSLQKKGTALREIPVFTSLLERIPYPAHGPPTYLSLDEDWFHNGEDRFVGQAKGLLLAHNWSPLQGETEDREQIGDRLNRLGHFLKRVKDSGRIPEAGEIILSPGFTPERYLPEITQGILEKFDGELWPLVKNPQGKFQILRVHPRSEVRSPVEEEAFDLERDRREAGEGRWLQETFSGKGPETAAAPDNWKIPELRVVRRPGPVLNEDEKKLASELAREFSFTLLANLFYKWQGRLWRVSDPPLERTVEDRFKSSQVEPGPKRIEILDEAIDEAYQAEKKNRKAPSPRVDYPHFPRDRALLQRLVRNKTPVEIELISEFVPKSPQEVILSKFNQDSLFFAEGKREIKVALTSIRKIVPRAEVRVEDWSQAAPAERLKAHYRKPPLNKLVWGIVDILEKEVVNQLERELGLGNAESPEREVSFSERDIENLNKIRGLLGDWSFENSNLEDAYTKLRPLFKPGLTNALSMSVRQDFANALETLYRLAMGSPLKDEERRDAVLNAQIDLGVSTQTDTLQKLRILMLMYRAIPQQDEKLPPKSLKSSIASQRYGTEIRDILYKYGLYDPRLQREVLEKRIQQMRLPSTVKGSPRAEVRADSGAGHQKIFVRLLDEENLIPVVVRYIDLFLKLAEEGAVLADQTGSALIQLSVAGGNEVSLTIGDHQTLILARDFGEPGLNVQESNFPVITEWDPGLPGLAAVYIALDREETEYLKLEILRQQPKRPLEVFDVNPFISVDARRREQAIVIPKIIQELPLREIVLRSSLVKGPLARAEVRAPGEEERLLEGVGEMTPDWQRLNIIGSTVLDVRRKGRLVKLEDIVEIALKKLEGEGLKIERNQIQKFLDRLVNTGFLKKEGERYRPTTSDEVFAIKFENVPLIRRRLAVALGGLRRKKKDAKANLGKLLLRYSKAVERWTLYPVESRWPVLKAVALLGKEEEEALAAFIRQSGFRFRRSGLIDSIALMLESEPSKDWLQRQASEIIGRTIYYIAAELWLPAGGLGRVGQYHTAKMKRLVGNQAQVVTIEPYYPFKAHTKVEIESNGEVKLRDEIKPTDYTKLSVPVENLEELPFELEVSVSGNPVKAKVFRGKNQFGIETFFIKDVGDYYTRILYRYGRDGTAHWHEFTEFFSRASLELIKKLEAEKKVSLGPAYREPVLWTNDGQTGPFHKYKRENDQTDSLLRNALLWMVTHTYKNRGWFQQLWSDSTSIGIREATDDDGGTSAVSAVHRDEVASRDPEARLIAITNGDDREASSEVFRSLLKNFFPEADPDQPAVDQIQRVKREAKKLIQIDETFRRLDPVFEELDPLKPVISYSGRMVEEKAGRRRAFTDQNLWNLVEAGAQIVIFGNVQSQPPRSAEMYLELRQLARQINEEARKHPDRGRLLAATDWGIPEQRKLLAATDIQVQDSDRATGAAEYTEADVSANGGLQMGPWLEGIIQRQGIILDRTVPGSGNTLIPPDGSPQAYLGTLLWAVKLYQEKPDQFASYQAASVRLSRILEAALTSAEYLRQFQRAIELKKQKLERESVRKLLRDLEVDGKYYWMEKKRGGRGWVTVRIPASQISFLKDWPLYFFWGYPGEKWKPVPVSGRLIPAGNFYEMRFGFKISKEGTPEYKLFAAPRDLAVIESPVEKWAQEALWRGEPFQNDLLPRKIRGEPLVKRFTDAEHSQEVKGPHSEIRSEARSPVDWERAPVERVKLGPPHHFRRIEWIVAQLVYEFNKWGIQLALAREGAKKWDEIPVPVEPSLEAEQHKIRSVFLEYTPSNNPLRIAGHSSKTNEAAIKFALKLMTQLLSFSRAKEDEIDRRLSGEMLSYYHEAFTEKAKLLGKFNETNEWGESEFRIEEKLSHEHLLRESVPLLSRVLKTPFLITLEVQPPQDVQREDPYELHPHFNLKERLPIFVLREDLLKDPRDPRFPLILKGDDLFFRIQGPTTPARVSEVARLFKENLEGKASGRDFENKLQELQAQWDREKLEPRAEVRSQRELPRVANSFTGLQRAISAYLKRDESVEAIDFPELGRSYAVHEMPRSNIGRWMRGILRGDLEERPPFFFYRGPEDKKTLFVTLFPKAPRTETVRFYRNDFLTWKSQTALIGLKPNKGQLRSFLTDILGARWKWYVPRKTSVFLVYQRMAEETPRQRHFAWEPLGFVVENSKEVIQIPLYGAGKWEAQPLLTEKSQSLPLRMTDPVRFEKVLSRFKGKEIEPESAVIEFEYRPRLRVREPYLGVREVLFDSSFDLSRWQKSSNGEGIQAKIANRIFAQWIPGSRLTEIFWPEEKIGSTAWNVTEAVGIFFYFLHAVIRASRPLSPDWFFWQVRAAFMRSRIRVELQTQEETFVYQYDRAKNKARATSNGRSLDEAGLKMGWRLCKLALRLARDLRQERFLPALPDDKTFSRELNQWLASRSEARTRSQLEEDSQMIARDPDQLKDQLKRLFGGEVTRGIGWQNLAFLMKPNGIGLNLRAGDIPQNQAGYLKFILGRVEDWQLDYPLKIQLRRREHSLNEIVILGAEKPEAQPLISRRDEIVESLQKAREVKNSKEKAKQENEEMDKKQRQLRQLAGEIVRVRLQQGNILDLPFLPSAQFDYFREAAAPPRDFSVERLNRLVKQAQSYLQFCRERRGGKEYSLGALTYLERLLLSCLLPGLFRTANQRVNVEKSLEDLKKVLSNKPEELAESLKKVTVGGRIKERVKKEIVENLFSGKRKGSNSRGQNYIGDLRRGSSDEAVKKLISDAFSIIEKTLPSLGLSRAEVRSEDFSDESLEDLRRNLRTQVEELYQGVLSRLIAQVKEDLLDESGGEEGSAIEGIEERASAVVNSIWTGFLLRRRNIREVLRQRETSPLGTLFTFVTHDIAYDTLLENISGHMSQMRSESTEDGEEGRKLIQEIQEIKENLGLGFLTGQVSLNLRDILPEKWLGHEKAAGHIQEMVNSVVDTESRFLEFLSGKGKKEEDYRRSVRARKVLYSETVEFVRSVLQERKNLYGLHVGDKFFTALVEALRDYETEELRRMGRAEVRALKRKKVQGTIAKPSLSIRTSLPLQAGSEDLARKLVSASRTSSDQVGWIRTRSTPSVSEGERAAKSWSWVIMASFSLPAMAIRSLSFVPEEKRKGSWPRERTSSSIRTETFSSRMNRTPWKFLGGAKGDVFQAFRDLSRVMEGGADMFSGEIGIMFYNLLIVRPPLEKLEDKIDHNPGGPPVDLKARFPAADFRIKGDVLFDQIIRHAGKLNTGSGRGQGRALSSFPSRAEVRSEGEPSRDEWGDLTDMSRRRFLQALAALMAESQKELGEFIDQAVRKLISEVAVDEAMLKNILYYLELPTSLTEQYAQGFPEKPRSRWRPSSTSPFFYVLVREKPPEMDVEALAGDVLERLKAAVQTVEAQIQNLDVKSEAVILEPEESLDQFKIRILRGGARNIKELLSYWTALSDEEIEMRQRVLSVSKVRPVGNEQIIKGYQDALTKAQGRRADLERFKKLDPATQQQAIITGLRSRLDYLRKFYRFVKPRVESTAKQAKERKAQKRARLRTRKERIKTELEALGMQLDELDKRIFRPEGFNSISKRDRSKRQKLMLREVNLRDQLQRITQRLGPSRAEVRSEKENDWQSVILARRDEAVSLPYYPYGRSDFFADPEGAQLTTSRAILQFRIPSSKGEEIVYHLEWPEGESYVIVFKKILWSGISSTELIKQFKSSGFKDAQMVDAAEEVPIDDFFSLRREGAHLQVRRLIGKGPESGEMEVKAKQIRRAEVRNAAQTKALKVAAMLKRLRRITERISVLRREIRKQDPEAAFFLGRASGDYLLLSQLEFEKAREALEFALKRLPSSSNPISPGIAVRIRLLESEIDRLASEFKKYEVELPSERAWQWGDYVNEKLDRTMNRVKAVLLGSPNRFAGEKLARYREELEWLQKSLPFQIEDPQKAGFIKDPAKRRFVQWMFQIQPPYDNPERLDVIKKLREMFSVHFGKSHEHDLDLPAVTLDERIPAAEFRSEARNQAKAPDQAFLYQAHPTLSGSRRAEVRVAHRITEEEASRRLKGHDLESTQTGIQKTLDQFGERMNQQLTRLDERTIQSYQGFIQFFGEGYQALKAGKFQTAYFLLHSIYPSVFFDLMGGQEIEQDFLTALETLYQLAIGSRLFDPGLQRQALKDAHDDWVDLLIDRNAEWKRWQKEALRLSLKFSDRKEEIPPKELLNHLSGESGEIIDILHRRSLYDPHLQYAFFQDALNFVKHSPGPRAEVRGEKETAWQRGREVEAEEGRISDALASRGAVPTNPEGARYPSPSGLPTKRFEVRLGPRPYVPPLELTVNPKVADQSDKDKDTPNHNTGQGSFQIKDESGGINTRQAQEGLPQIFPSPAGQSKYRHELELTGGVTISQQENDEVINPPLIQDFRRAEVRSKRPMDQREVQPAQKLKAPRPVRSYEPDKEKLRQWINAHEEPYQPMAQFIADHITHISQEKFEDALQKSIDAFNHAIGTRPFLVVIENQQGDYKSGDWVYDLAEEHGISSPRAVVRFWGNYSFHENDDEVLAGALEKNPEVSDLLLFDDTSFSGSQLEGVTERIQEVLRIKNRQMKFHFVVPFMTQAARRRLPKGSRVYKINLIPTVRQIFTGEILQGNKAARALLKQASEVYRDDQNRTKVLTYFDHHLPDLHSTLSNEEEVIHSVLEGAVLRPKTTDVEVIPFIPEILEPYRTKEYFLFKEKKGLIVPGRKPESSENARAEVRRSDAVKESVEGYLKWRDSDPERTQLQNEQASWNQVPDDDYEFSTSGTVQGDTPIPLKDGGRTYEEFLDHSAFPNGLLFRELMRRREEWVKRRLLGADQPMEILDIGMGKRYAMFTLAIQLAQKDESTRKQMEKLLRRKTFSEEDPDVKRLAETLARHYQFYGVDVSARAFESEDPRARPLHLAFMNAEVLRPQLGMVERMRPEWTGKFHYVLAVGLIGHLYDKLRMIEEVHRVLASNGQAQLTYLEPSTLNFNASPSQSQTDKMALTEFLKEIQKGAHHHLKLSDIKPDVLMMSKLPGEPQLIFGYELVRPTGREFIHASPSEARYIPMELDHMPTPKPLWWDQAVVQLARPRRAEVRREERAVRLDSTAEFRKDLKEGRAARRLERRLGPVIENLWKRPEVRRRLGRDGFLPDLSKFIRMPEAEAAETAIRAGILFRQEGLHSSRAERADRGLQNWVSHLGLSAAKREARLAFIYLSGAAVGRTPLLPTIGETLNVSGEGTLAGVVVSRTYHAFVEKERRELTPGQELIEGEELSKVLADILTRHPNEVIFIQSPEDELAPDLIRKLRERNIRSEIRIVTQAALERAHLFAPALVEEIESFRREVSQAQSLQAAA